MTKRQDLRIPMPVWETFLRSCGLRRTELERLRVGDITQDEDGQIWLHVAESEESPTRDVLVFSGFSWAIVDILAQKFPSNPGSQHFYPCAVEAADTERNNCCWN